MTGTAGLSQLPRGRRLINVLTARVVGLGGAAVIAAIALIFFYLLWVVAPIFAGAGIETGERYALEPAEPLLIQANDSEEMALRIDATGTATFFELDGGAVRSRMDLGRELAQVQPLAEETSQYAVLDVDGEMTFLEATYPVSFEGDTRVVNANLDYLFEDAWVDVGSASAFDVHFANFEVLIATVEGRELTVHRFRNAEPGFALEFPRRGRYELRRNYDRVFFGPRGRWVYLVSLGGAVEVVDLARPAAPSELFIGRLAPEGSRLSEVTPLLGRYSLLVANQAGKVSQWFMVRGEFGQQLEQVRSFDLGAPAVRIIRDPVRRADSRPEDRRAHGERSAGLPDTSFGKGCRPRHRLRRSIRCATRAIARNDAGQPHAASIRALRSASSKNSPEARTPAASRRGMPRPVRRR